MSTTQSSVPLRRVLEGAVPLLLGIGLLGFAVWLAVESHQLATGPADGQPSALYEAVVGRVLTPAISWFSGGGREPAPADLASTLSRSILVTGFVGAVLTGLAVWIVSRPRRSSTV